MYTVGRESEYNNTAHTHEKTPHIKFTPQRFPSLFFTSSLERWVTPLFLTLRIKRYSEGEKRKRVYGVTGVCVHLQVSG